MVLAKLAGSVAHGLEHGGRRRRLVGHAKRGAGLTDGGQSGANGQLTRNKVRTTGRAARLSIIVGEPHTFGRHLVKVWRANSHHPLSVNTDISPADIITHDEYDIGLLLLRACRRTRDHHHGD